VDSPGSSPPAGRRSPHAGVAARGGELPTRAMRGGFMPTMTAKWRSALTCQRRRYLAPPRDASTSLRAADWPIGRSWCSFTSAARPTNSNQPVGSLTRCGPVRASRRWSGRVRSHPRPEGAAGCERPQGLAPPLCRPPPTPRSCCWSPSAWHD